MSGGSVWKINTHNSIECQYTVNTHRQMPAFTQTPTVTLKPRIKQCAVCGPTVGVFVIQGGLEVE